MRPWPKQRLRNKFGAKRTNGFASKLENAVHDLLKLMERAGEISNIRCQHQVRLSRAGIGYKPDFSYVDKATGEMVWVEAKGVETEGYMIRKNLWKFYGPGKLQIYKGNYKRPMLADVIVPKKFIPVCLKCGQEIQE